MLGLREYIEFGNQEKVQTICELFERCNINTKERSDDAAKEVTKF
jgi:hypothetical protein